jgi:hypothetical protein
MARAGAAVGDEGFDEVGPRLRRDQGIPARPARRAASTPAAGYRRLGIRSVKHTGMVEPEVASPVVCQRSRKQALDGVDCFRQPLVTLAPAGPAGANDVLVQVLAGVQPQVNRLSLGKPKVAAPWATIAGWYRIVGQVTAVIKPIRRVAFATAPRTGQASGA